MARRPDPLELIDTDRYPIHDRTLAAYAGLIEQQRGAFRQHGLAVMPGFVTTEALDLLRAECDQLASLGHRQESRLGDAGVEPAGASRLVAVAYDLFPIRSLLRALYESDALLALVADVVGELSLFRHSDPLGALELAVMMAGDELGWHADAADFAVSLAVQQPNSGGAFEYSVGSPSDSAVAVAPFDAGTLMILAGRETRHRVTTVDGPRPRYVAAFAFDTRPGTNSTDAAKLARYGRLATPSRRA